MFIRWVYVQLSYHLILIGIISNYIGSNNKQQGKLRIKAT
jgi:hypothetical protein